MLRPPSPPEAPSSPRSQRTIARCACARTSVHWLAEIDASSQIYEYYNQYLNAAGDKDAQERWSRQLIWEIARHSIGEEIVVYPLLEKHLGAEGKALADGDRNDHQVRSLSV